MYMSMDPLKADKSASIKKSYTHDGQKNCHHQLN